MNVYYSITANLNVYTWHMGDPVFPVKPEWKDWFISIAEKKGCKAIGVPIDNTDNRKQESANSFVLAMSEGVSKPAPLYAHLSSRKFLLFKEKSKFENVECIFCDEQLLTPDWVQHITTISGFVPGLFFDSSSEGLYKQVLSKSLFLLISRKNKSDLLTFSLLPALPFSRIIVNKKWSVYGSANKEKLTEEKLSSYNFLHIQAHSDGVDAKISPMILCGVRNKLHTNTDGQKPLCMESGMCYRLNTKLEKAMQSALLITPDRLNVQSVFFNCCYGVFFTGTPVDRHFSIHYQLMTNPFLATLITTYGITRVNFNEDLALFNLLRKGKTIGEAVSFFNRKFRKEGMPTLMILGEPSISYLKDQENNFTLDQSVKKSSLREFEQLFRDLSFTKNYLHSQKDIVTGRLKKMLTKTLKSVTNYEKELLQKQNIFISEKTGRLFRKLFANYHLERGFMLFLDWEKMAKWNKKFSTEVCANCGNKKHVTEFSFWGHHAYKRILIDCPNCDLEKDADKRFSNFSCSFKKNGILSIEGDWKKVKKFPYSIYLIYHYKQISLRSMYEWPINKAGEPVENFKIPPSKPGPLMLSIYIISGGSFTILNKYTRGEYTIGEF